MSDVDYLEHYIDAIHTIRFFKEQGRTHQDVCKEFGITGDWFDCVLFMCHWKVRHC